GDHTRGFIASGFSIRGATPPRPPLPPPLRERSPRRAPRLSADRPPCSCRADRLCRDAETVNEPACDAGPAECGGSACPSTPVQRAGCSIAPGTQAHGSIEMKLMRLEEAATRALLLITLSVVIALAPAPAWAQQAPRTLQGQVVDGRTSSPLAGVVVRVHDRMVRTDGEGRFTFVGGPDTALVHFDRIGYRAERTRVTSLGGTVALEPEPVLLDAVVVTTPQQNALAVGTALSVASVDAEAMHSGAHASVADAL